jgi:hypothetical protein
MGQQGEVSRRVCTSCCEPETNAGNAETGNQEIEFLWTVTSVMYTGRWAGCEAEPTDKSKILSAKEAA